MAMQHCNNCRTVDTVNTASTSKKCTSLYSHGLVRFNLPPHGSGHSIVICLKVEHNLNLTLTAEPILPLYLLISIKSIATLTGVLKSTLPLGFDW